MTLTIDAHCDAFMRNYLSGRRLTRDPLTTMPQVTGTLIRRGGLNLEVFAAFVPDTFVHEADVVAVNMIEEGKDWMRHEEISLIDSRKGLLSLNERDTAGIIGLERAAPLGRNPENLKRFYQIGVRVLTIVWSRRNPFASGVGFPGPLTEKGRQLVRLAEESGVVLDISHLNPEGAADVLRLAEKPVIASNSCAMALNANPRNLTDDQIEGIASAGGVICVNFYPDFLCGKKDADIGDVVRHIMHIVVVAGRESAGLGSDFDGIPNTPFGLENASQMKDLVPLLLDAGLTKEEVNLLTGENFRRVFSEVLK